MTFSSSCHLYPILNYNFLSTSTKYDNMWILDTRATDHMCVSSTPIHNIRTLAKPIQLGFAETRATSVNKVRLIDINDAITLDNVLQITIITINLLSISQFTTKTGCTSRSFLTLSPYRMPKEH